MSQWSTECLGLSGPYADFFALTIMDGCRLGHGQKSDGPYADLFALTIVDGCRLRHGQKPAGKSQEGGPVGTKAFG